MPGKVTGPVSHDEGHFGNPREQNRGGQRRLWSASVRVFRLVQAHHQLTSDGTSFSDSSSHMLRLL